MLSVKTARRGQFAGAAGAMAGRSSVAAYIRQQWGALCPTWRARASISVARVWDYSAMLGNNLNTFAFDDLAHAPNALSGRLAERFQAGGVGGRQGDE